MGHIQDSLPEAHHWALRMPFLPAPSLPWQASHCPWHRSHRPYSQGLSALSCAAVPDFDLEINKQKDGVFLKSTLG